MIHNVQPCRQSWIALDQDPLQADCSMFHGFQYLISASQICQNRIKGQAREHERFRRICVQTAQAIHRWDMRFKLGLLQDTATIEKQVAREAAEAQARKHKHDASPSRTDESATTKEKDKTIEKAKEPTKVKHKIRPLSEAKAIDAGANFVSETFLLLVGVALILGEQWRQSRKATSRREDAAERLADMAERLASFEEYLKADRRGMVELEREVIRLRGKDWQNADLQPHILPRTVWELEEKEEAEEEPKPQSWTDWIRDRTIGGRETAEQAVSKRTEAKEGIQRPELQESRAVTKKGPNPQQISEKSRASSDSLDLAFGHPEVSKNPIIVEGSKSRVEE